MLGMRNSTGPARLGAILEVGPDILGVHLLMFRIKVGRIIANR
jgi:hypothetical protein